MAISLSSYLRPARLDAGNSRRWAACCVAAAALVVLSPFFLFGQASGHDLDFHLTSWMDAAQQWREGVLFPRWAAWANYGYGEPRFIFYPPISWCLGAALGSVMPWNAVPDVFIFVALLLAGLSMHRLARDWMPPHGAVAAAVIYAVNPYHLVIVYLRSDFAELLASAMFPLAVHYALNGASVSPPAEGGKLAALSRVQSGAALAAVYGAIWLTNAPAAVVASYALAFSLAVRAIHLRSFTPILTGAAGLAGGLALAACYVLPAKLEQPWVNIGQAISPGLRFSENYLFTRTAEAEHNLFNLEVSAVAVTMLVLTGIAAIVVYGRCRSGSQASRHSVLTLALAGLSAVMMFPVSGAAWAHLPELQFVQFPWRWLFPLALSLALFWGETLAAAPPRRRITVLLLGSLGAVMALGLIWRATWNPDEVDDNLASVQGAGYEGTDEYCPRGGDQYDLSQTGPLVQILPDEDDADVSQPAAPASSLIVETWSPERKVFTADSAQPARAALRLLNYPAWQVRVNSQPVAAESAPHTAQMLIPLERGRSRVEVRFGRTQDRTAGAALSIFAASLIIAALAGAKRRPPRTGSA